MNNSKIAIIGDGVFTEFVLSTSLKQVDSNTSRFIVFSENQNRLNELRESHNINTTSDPKNLADASVVLLALQSRDAEKIVPKIKSEISSSAMVMSVVDHWKISRLEEIFPTQAVIRVEVTPAIINADGVITYVTGSKQAVDSDIFIQMIFSRLGKVFRAESEEEFERIGNVFLAATVASNQVIKSMIRGAINAGLSSERAKEIIAQIIRGEIGIETQPDEIVAELREKAFRGRNMTVFLEEGISLIHEYGMWNFLRN